MRSGPAFDCKSVRNAQNPSSEPPTAFPRMLTPERLVCIAEALWAFCLSANPATRRSPVSRVLSLSLPPSLPSARPSVLPSPSQASLGLGDVDFDAVRALRGRVLPKGGGLFGSQQALAGLLSLLLRRRRGRRGRGVRALLAAQQRSALTGLL